MFGVVSQTKAVKGRLQTLVQLNLELAKREGKQKMTSLGVAGGLGIGALVLAVYGIGFAFATAAAGLSEALPWWLSLLIVTAIIFVLAAIAGFLRCALPVRPRLRSRRWRSKRPSEPSALSRDMSERSVEDIRNELAAERQALNDDLARLKSDVRSLAVFVVVGLLVVGCVTFFVGKRKGARTIWRLVK